MGAGWWDKGQPPVLDDAGNLAVAGGIGLHGVTPPAQAAAIADVASTDSGTGGDDATFVVAINAIIAALEANGIVAP
jgi:hypothetical protein